MPIGNFTYKPIHRNILEVSDIDYFVLGLLKDICSSSTNSLLNTAVVNYNNEFNLAKIQEDFYNTKLLISFVLRSEDIRNDNLKTEFNSNVNRVKVSYDITLLAKKEETDEIDLKKALEEVENAICFNWNGTASKATDYSIILPNGKTIKSSLTLNLCSTIPTYSVGEDTKQINYLTGIANILFNIYI